MQVHISLALPSTYEDFSITETSARERVFGQEDHVRIYVRAYRDRLENAGFKVDVFSWTTEHVNFGGRRNVFGLNEEENVYFVGKG